jgi:AcrR family transcriptional regulator
VATGSRRRLSAEERREAILAAAMEVFADRGYHGASIDQVAQAAGISKSLIYEHFASKADLHASLVEGEVAELFERLAANAARGTRGEDRLRGGIDAFLGFVEERRVAWRMLFRDAADREVADVLDRVEAQAVNVILALSEDEAGGRPPQVREVYARLLSGAVQALANWWLDHPEVPREELVERVVDFAWRGLREASGPPR